MGSGGSEWTLLNEVGDPVSSFQWQNSLLSHNNYMEYAGSNKDGRISFQNSDCGFVGYLDDSLSSATVKRVNLPISKYGYGYFFQESETFSRVDNPEGGFDFITLDADLESDEACELVKNLNLSFPVSEVPAVSPVILTSSDFNIRQENVDWTPEFAPLQTTAIEFIETPLCERFDTQPSDNETDLDILLLFGDTAPDGNGVIKNVHGLSLNDEGQVAFSAVLGFSQSDPGIYRADKNGLVELARQGQVLPGDGGVIDSFGLENLPVINESGKVVFDARLEKQDDDSIRPQAIFLADENSLTILAKRGTPISENSDVYFNFFTPLGYSNAFPSLNNSNQVAIWATLTGEVDSTNNEGIFLLSDSGSVTIAREGFNSIEERGAFENLVNFNVFDELPSINDAGQVVFEASIGLGDGIFVGDMSGVSEVIYDDAETPPIGNGGLTFLNYNINDLGDVNFLVSWPDPENIGGVFPNSLSGIFTSTESGIISVVSNGEESPNGDGIITLQNAGFNNEFHNLAPNNAGLVAFATSLSETPGGGADDFAIYSGNNLGLAEVARKGQLVPGDDGVFSFNISLSDVGSNADPLVNDQGQVVFATSLQETSRGSENDYGIYFYDENIGLLEVARHGDELLGSEIIDLEINNYPPDNESTSFNNLGQVAFQFRLLDGRGGVALWAPPRNRMNVELEAFRGEDRVYLRWPAEGVGNWILESKLGLDQASSWRPVEISAELKGEFFEVPISVDSMQMYFRLFSGPQVHQNQ